MIERTKRVPGPDHPITIERNPARITVSVAGAWLQIPMTRSRLAEACTAVSTPRKDVDMSLLERTQHSTYCPYKGDARTQYSERRAKSVNAIWTYERRFPRWGDKRIRGVLPDRSTRSRRTRRS